MPTVTLYGGKMKSFFAVHKSRIAAQKNTAGQEDNKGVIARLPLSSGKADTPLSFQRCVATLMHAIGEDLKALKGIQSTALKEQFKRDELVPRYAEQIAKLIQANRACEPVAYFMLWLFDAGLFEKALHHLPWCIEHNQGLPESFKSSLPFLAVSKITEWANTELGKGHSANPYLKQIIELYEAGDWDIKDSLKADLYRLQGMQAELDGQLADARIAYEKSLGLGGKVKTKLENVCKALSKEAAA